MNISHRALLFLPKKKGFTTTSTIKLYSQNFEVSYGFSTCTSFLFSILSRILLCCTSLINIFFSLLQPTLFYIFLFLFSFEKAEACVCDKIRKSIVEREREREREREQCTQMEKEETVDHGWDKLRKETCWCHLTIILLNWPFYLDS